MASARKEVKELLREARRQGWRVREGKHYMLYAPDGVGKVSCPKTPGDVASLRNVVAKMRRHGFVWKGH